MNILYLCKIAYLNLSDRRKAALFSASGLILGICILTLATGIGSGLGNMVGDEISKQSADKIITVEQSQNGSVKIDQNMAKNIAGVTGVKKIEQEADLAGKFSYGGSTTDVVTLAVTEGYFYINNIDLPNGVVLKKTDQDEPQPIIINSSLAKLFGFKMPKNFLGSEIFADVLLTKQNSKNLVDQNVDQQRTALGKFRIVAVINQGGNPLAYIPHQMVVDHNLTYDSQVWALTDNLSQLQLARINIENMGLRTSNIADSLSSAKKVFQSIQIILLAIGLIMILIATISLINVLKSDLYLRNDELGYLKALGINQQKIGLMLSIENIYLTLFSAIIGVGAASVVGIATNFIFKYIAENRGDKVYPLYTVSALSVIVGVLMFIILNFVLSYYCWIKLRAIPAKRGMIDV